MMQTLVGRDGFARGMTLYFERHDGQAVTCDDFAQAIADANPGSELADAAAAVQALVRAGRHAARDGARPLRRAVAHLHARPRAVRRADAGPADKQPFVIPVAIGLVGARRPGAAAAPRRTSRGRGGTERVLVLDEPRSVLHLRRRRRASRCRRCCAASRRRCMLVDGLSDADLLRAAAPRQRPVQPLGGRPAPGAAAACSRRCAAASAAAARRRLRRRDARRAAPPDARPGLQGAGADAAERGLRRRAARQRRSAAHPRRARSDEAQLARALRADWAWAFEAHQVDRRLLARPGVVGPPRARQPGAGDALPRRRAQRGDAVWPGRAYQRFKDAGNMTDRQGALTRADRLARRAGRAGARALPRACSGTTPLVIDKWFALQADRARARRPGVRARASALLRHPDFTLAQPEPGAQPDRRASAWATRRRSTAPTPPATCSGPTACSSSTRSTRSWPSRIARALDRWTQLAEPYRAAAREAIDAGRRARRSFPTTCSEIVSRALLGS